MSQCHDVTEAGRRGSKNLCRLFSFQNLKGVLFMAKENKSVVRNAQYRRGGLSVRQRHNERQNADYMNDDIIKDRAAYNVHFKQPTGSYEAAFDALIAEGVISTRGLKKDPHIVDELVFGINTDYFEQHGGYEYAKSFFAEAYRCAIEEIGGEQFVLSAVMHADERNKALSEKYGRDIYHYHLHVVYVPVVQKEIYFKKDNKDPEKAGKLREVITQVSHSKKWPKHKKLDDNGEVVRNAKGNAVLVNAYSLLQDHFYNHMTEAGYTGFERGERGSTAEHLSVVEYKTQQEIKRAAEAAAVVEEKQATAAALDDVIERKEKTAATLDKKVEHRVKQVNSLDKKIDDRNYAVTDIKAINQIGKTKNLVGQIVVTPEDLRYLKDFAREGANSRVIITDLQEKVKRVEGERDTWKTKYTQLLERVQPFLDAVKHAPKKVMAFLKSILREPPEVNEPPARVAPDRRRSSGLDL
jgi:hypothetical protein